jgi:hypothetical protein
VRGGVRAPARRPSALVLALGLAKIAWVAGTGRPVGYLVGLMIATVVAATDEEAPERREFGAGERRRAAQGKGERDLVAQGRPGGAGVACAVAFKIAWVAGTGRPVGYLVGLMIATVVAATFLHIRPVRRRCSVLGHRPRAASRSASRSVGAVSLRISWPRSPAPGARSAISSA